MDQTLGPRQPFWEFVDAQVSAGHTDRDPAAVAALTGRLTGRLLGLLPALLPDPLPDPLLGLLSDPLPVR